jgi:hypothetical protein
MCYGRTDKVWNLSPCTSDNRSLPSFSLLSSLSRMTEFIIHCFLLFFVSFIVYLLAMNAISGQRVNPFRCYLPQLKTSHEGFTTLFVNGERYWRARYPNEDKVNYTVWGGE